MSESATTSAPAAGHEFPRFDPEYRQRWVAAGLWGDRTLHELFDETVAARPDAVAVSTIDRRYTFAALKTESDALAAGLIGWGCAGATSSPCSCPTGSNSSSSSWPCRGWGP